MPDVGKSKFYKHLDSEVKDYEANKEVHNMDSKKSVTDHDHFFTMVKGTEAQCSCGWGIFIDVEDDVREGHIYRHNKLII